MGELSGKTAFVSGGTSGIGKAIVKRFLQEGASVVFNGLTQAEGDAVAAELHQDGLGDYAFFLNADVAKQAEVEQLIEYTREKLGTVDIIVNNAGVKVQVGDARAHSLEEFEKTMRINLTPYFLFVKAFVQGMLDQNSGSIINIASTMGLQGAPGHLAYAVSKGANITLTQSMALDYSPYGVRVNAIAPGLIRTPATSDWIDEQTDAAEVKGIPLGRAGLPNEIAEVALFLATQRASYITGAVIPVDGGLSTGE